MRGTWDMHFVEGGDEALAFMNERHVDVVVSDMRMPGMDGAELLGKVRTISPSTARIILSGYAEEEAVFRSTRVAHQFLSKPCDLDELRNTIEEIRGCMESVEPEAIRDLIGQLEQLPALGDVYDELVDAMDRDNSSNEALGRIVSKDVALTAELLRLINSAFFGLSRQVESVAQAIGFLGVDVVRAIVAGHSLFSGAGGGVVDVDEVASRSQGVAALARTVFRMEGGTASEAAEAYLAGMLHQVGVLVLSVLPGVDKADLTAVLASEDVTNERLAIGADRFAVGGYLLGFWGFSPGIVSAITSQAEPYANAEEPVAWALRVAIEAARSGRVSFSDEDDPLEPQLQEVAAELRAGVQQTKVTEGVG
jgi:HD-like signal output (HDOD) protein